MTTGSGGTQSAPVPNMAGKAITVRGPLDPDQLGTTIMHEHLFIDFRRSVVPDDDVPVTEWAQWDRTLTMENLRMARDRKSIADNRLLTDERSAVNEAMEFRYRGGGTIVDVNSIGLRRDPEALRRVSYATGLNVVMGAGWYQKQYHPANMDERTVEDLSEEIIRDVTVGVGDTGIRAGIIGEIGVNGDPITPNEVKSIRAAARASRATGAAITLHRGGAERERFDVIGMMGEEGADMSRVIFGHSDLISGDLPLMLELLRLGVYIQFDLVGTVGTHLDLTPTRDAFEVLLNSAYVATEAAVIPRLIEAGHADRLLLSQDVCTKAQLRGYGGNGYAFVLEKFLPHLRSQGVSEEHIQMFMVDNPKRVLTFVEPA